MRKFVMILPAAMFVLGTMAMTDSVQAQGLGAAKVSQQLKNATPYIEKAACNGTTGGCGCGPGWVTSCPGGCCTCVPCGGGGGYSARGGGGYGAYGGWGHHHGWHGGGDGWHGGGHGGGHRHR